MSVCLKRAEVAAAHRSAGPHPRRVGHGQDAPWRAPSTTPRCRGARSFVSFSSAAFSDTLLDSQLFGHERGAFYRRAPGPQRQVRARRRRHPLHRRDRGHELGRPGQDPASRRVTASSSVWALRRSGAAGRPADFRHLAIPRRDSPSRGASAGTSSCASAGSCSPSCRCARGRAICPSSRPRSAAPSRAQRKAIIGLDKAAADRIWPTRGQATFRELKTRVGLHGRCARHGERHRP